MEKYITAMKEHSIACVGSGFKKPYTSSSLECLQKQSHPHPSHAGLSILYIPIHITVATITTDEIMVLELYDCSLQQNSFHLHIIFLLPMVQLNHLPPTYKVAVLSSLSKYKAISSSSDDTIPTQSIFLQYWPTIYFQLRQLLYYPPNIDWRVHWFPVSENGIWVFDITNWSV